MLGVHTLGAEFGDAEVGRLLEQVALVEALANRGRGVRNQSQVGKADLTTGQSHQAVVQLVQLPAHAHAVGSRAAGHMADILDPGDRAVIAHPIVFVGLGEIAGHAGELDFKEVDGVAEAN